MRQTRVASAVCNLYRKPQSVTQQMSKLVRLTSKTKYTDGQLIIFHPKPSDLFKKMLIISSLPITEEMHAELCYAESLLERALLMFVKDENLVSFLKGALKIRSCFNSYK